MDVNKIPMTHGMEVEQHDVPHEIQNDYDNKFWGHWEYDASGPMEMEFGPGKHVKRLIDDFNETALQYDQQPWTWKSSDGSTGAGSHVHFNVEMLETEDDTVTGWTIAYNTILDLLPFFAPFFCHDWEKGFRNGTNYNPNLLNINKWAKPETTRMSRDRMHGYYHGRVSREYKSITLNPRLNDKPMTIELRLSDSHPAFALTGSYFLRKIAKRCFERDASVKIDRQASDTSDVLKTLYDRIYDLPDRKNMIDVLQEDLKIVFEREIPGLKQEYESPWAVLLAIIKDLKPRWDAERADSRACELIKFAGRLTETRRADPFTVPIAKIPNPARNRYAIWHIHEETFTWDCGPN